MHWIRRAVVVGGMTLITVSVHELVVPARMTGLARQAAVGPRQRELGRAVIKRRRLPRSGAVAHLALMAETCCRMIRIRGV